MSCFLAALGMVRCLNKAQKAIGDFNEVHVHRFGGGGATEEQKVMAWNLAERMGAVTSYLDDASFVAAAAALCVAYDAYTTKAAKPGWKCVESKSVLAHGVYKTADGETPKPHEDFTCEHLEADGIKRTPGVVQRATAMTRAGTEQSRSETNFISKLPPKHVELARGVYALRPEDGLVNLGIPVGGTALGQSSHAI